MAVVCAADCGGNPIPAAPQSYHDFCTDEFLPYGSNHFILLECDVDFPTDVGDTTPVTSDWATAITAGKVRKSPAGILTINPPDSEVIVVEGCRRQIDGQTTYTVDFVTYQRAADVSDFDYWNAVLKNVSSYRIMFLDCNGIYNVDDGFKALIDASVAGTPTPSAGANPGIPFSIIQTPTIIEGEANLSQWSIQFQIQKQGMLEMALIPGLESLLT